jgi:hypothetical protein
MTPGEWCADFVNGALKSANIKGISGSVANSFLNWGQQVTDGIKAGDVVVTHRGRQAGQPGGHVGLATGETRMKDGRLQYKTVSGNHGNRVGEGWEYQDRVEVRRAKEAAQQTKDLADGVNAGSYKPSQPGQGQGTRPNAAPAPITDSFGTVLGTQAPARNGGNGLGSQTPMRGKGGGGGGGNAPINVHIGAVNGGTAEDNGRIIAERIREAVNSAHHDVDPGGYA